MDNPEYTVYLYPSPNSLKVIIALEELNLRYQTVVVDLAEGQQLAPAFAALNPNRKVPVLTAGDLTLFESAAILEYLATTHDQLMGQTVQHHWQIKSWLYWHAAAFGPMAGQAHHFRCFAPEHVPYAVRRYSDEMNRLYGILEEQLAGREWVCDTYSIVDIGLWPWVRHHDWQGQSLINFPSVQRWADAMAARPAAIHAVERYPIQLIAPNKYGVLLNQTAASLKASSTEEEIN
jgi:GSH-dependent disulfide-bond oxidoreductase